MDVLWKVPSAADRAWLPVSPDLYQPDFQLPLLLESASGVRRRTSLAGAGSLAAHLVAFLALGSLQTVPLRTASPQTPGDEAKKYEKITLVAPRLAIQKTEPRQQVNREFNIESLQAREQSRLETPGNPMPSAPRSREFSLPAATRTPQPAPVMPDVPKINPVETAQVQPPAGAPIGNTPPRLTPPPPPPAEKPKLEFERPGQNTATGTVGLRPQPSLPVPSSSVQEAVRTVSRSGAAGRGVVVGDEDEGSGGLGSTIRPSPSSGKMGSRLELLSDTAGVDFAPYLIRVLSAVRRNWYAVIPESARFGRGGKTVIQFAIARDGSVPKLVIAGPSGADALDRAAVAGISASNPFPPLPVEFKGQQIRLQLVFSYNVQR